VADKDRRNGFRFAVTVASAEEGLALVDRVRPAIVRVDARLARDWEALARLIDAVGDAGGRVLFHHAERPEALTGLHGIAELASYMPLVQGHALDLPRAVLPGLAARVAA
jgi:hypothetical protein